jgi:hypothetical protein
MEGPTLLKLSSHTVRDLLFKLYNEVRAEVWVLQQLCTTRPTRRLVGEAAADEVYCERVKD